MARDKKTVKYQYNPHLNKYRAKGDDSGVLFDSKESAIEKWDALNPPTYESKVYNPKTGKDVPIKGKTKEDVAQKVSLYKREKNLGVDYGLELKGNVAIDKREYFEKAIDEAEKLDLWNRQDPPSNLTVDWLNEKANEIMINSRVKELSGLNTEISKLKEELGNNMDFDGEFDIDGLPENPPNAYKLQVEMIRAKLKPLYEQLGISLQESEERNKKKKKGLISTILGLFDGNESSDKPKVTREDKNKIRAHYNERVNVGGRSTPRWKSEGYNNVNEAIKSEIEKSSKSSKEKTSNELIQDLIQE